MTIKEFNEKLKLIYPNLSVRLVTCGIANMFSNYGATDTYQELALYDGDSKKKVFISKSVIFQSEIGELLNKHYMQFIKPALDKLEEDKMKELTPELDVSPWRVKKHNIPPTPPVEHPCIFCDPENVDFHPLNETTKYSQIEIAFFHKGMLRARTFNEEGHIIAQEIVGVTVCPNCGRKL